MKTVKWWMFWNPQSGLVGGLIGGTLLCLAYAFLLNL